MSHNTKRSLEQDEHTESSKLGDENGPPTKHLKSVCDPSGHQRPLSERDSNIPHVAADDLKKSTTEADHDDMESKPKRDQTNPPQNITEEDIIDIDFSPPLTTTTPTSASIETSSNASTIDIEIPFNTTQLIIPEEVSEVEPATEDTPFVTMYLLEKEQEQATETSLFANQAFLSIQHWKVLVDWLVEVCQMFGCVNETLFLAIYLLDRFFRRRTRTRVDQFQLLALTSFCIAAKFEEGRSPRLEQLVAICDHTYNTAHLKEMEILQLTTLEFQVGLVHPLHFLRRFSQAARTDQRTHNLAKYLCELSLLDSDIQCLKPSKIAAASVYAAQKMTRADRTWGDHLVRLTGFTVEQLHPVGLSLYNSFLAQQDESEEGADASYRKYAEVNLLCVSRLLPLQY